MTPPTVNAYYDPQKDDINFPAGILQPPLFSALSDAAPNYGDTGATMGHELTHAFDDEAASSTLRVICATGDRCPTQGIRAARQCVVDQYSGYPIIDDIKINGKLTNGEIWRILAEHSSHIWRGRKTQKTKSWNPWMG